MRLSAFGDVLHALPVLSALRAAWPKAEIGWAIEDRWAPLLAHRTDLDRIHLLPRAALKAARRTPWRLSRAVGPFRAALRGAAYDVALDLQGNLKSGLAARSSRAPLRLGLGGHAAKEANHLHTTRRWTPPEGPQHRVARGLGLLSQLLDAPAPYIAPGFPITAMEQDAARHRTEAAGVPEQGFALLHPGTSAFGRFKRWPPERFGLLARRLADRGWAVAVGVGPGEQDLGARAVDASGGAARLVAPGDLRELAALIAACGLFVAADTGPLHLASVLGRPLLGLFGPKDPALYGPIEAAANGAFRPLTTIVQPDVACRPCRLRRCADPLCMTTLSVDAVLDALPASAP